MSDEEDNREDDDEQDEDVWDDATLSDKLERGIGPDEDED